MRALLPWACVYVCELGYFYACTQDSVNLGFIVFSPLENGPRNNKDVNLLATRPG